MKSMNFKNHKNEVGNALSGALHQIFQRFAVMGIDIWIDHKVVRASKKRVKVGIAVLEGWNQTVGGPWP
ncbi:hypothetical protein ACFX2F_004688 [Malus domestica]